MTEPAVTTATAAIAAPSLVVLASQYLGVSLGPYLVIVLGAWCGSFWAIVSAPPMTKWQSFGLAGRAILLSVLMTAAVAHLMSEYFGWDLEELYVIVSISIAALGDKWLEIMNSLKDAVMTGMGNVFKKDTDK